MKILQGYSLNKFMTFIPMIRENIEQWRVVEVSLKGSSPHNNAYVAKKLKGYLGPREGAIFLCSSDHIVAIAHMGYTINDKDLPEDIQEYMPQIDCKILAEDITADGLLKIQLRLQEYDSEDSSSSASSLLRIRQKRQQPVVMIVDDDEFIRSLITKTFQPNGRVLEFEDTDQIVEIYLQELPDIVFLDIHMPGGSGIDVLAEILEFDDSAYVIILSSDSVKENVLNARKYGAQGFVVKPFTQGKLLDCYNKCPTIAPARTAKAGL